LLLAALALLGWAVWLIRDVLQPFLIAIALALLLDPLLTRMQRWGMPRGLSVATTFGLFLAGFVGVLAYVLPLVIHQIQDLLRNIDAYSAKLQDAADMVIQNNADLLQRLQLPQSLTELRQQYGEQVSGFLEGLLKRIFSSLQASAGFLGWVVIVPLVTLYLLADLERIRARLFHLVPPDRRDAVLRLSVEVARVFGAYLRGLTLICLAYSATVFLMLELGFHLPYSLVIGLVAAVLYAIPYLGQITLVIAACLVAWTTGHSLGYVGGVAAALVFVGQCYDQVITPRVMGQQVGIHPVVGVFALMVGGNLFGLPGMALAVPVAACSRVVLIHLFPRLAEPIPGWGRRRAAADGSGDELVHGNVEQHGEGGPGSLSKDVAQDQTEDER
jgi:predicted PurR-regulated permease PerM